MSSTRAFSRTGKRVVIVAAFMKKTRKTPKRWLDLAEERAKGVV